MRRISTIIAACLTMSGAGTAHAQPSFPCGGSLNATERAICRDNTLSALDVQMVRLFHEQRTEPDTLRSAQRTWLAWRNTCGADMDCIRRRYEQRILDFGGTPNASASEDGFILLDMTATLAQPTNNPNQVVDRRVASGRYEVEYADGRVEWRSLQGGSFGTDYPDGTSESYSAIQVPGDDFPALPGSYAAWGDGVEIGLLSIIDGYLNEADRAEYRAMQSSKPFSQRIPDHISVINFLAAQ